MKQAAAEWSLNRRVEVEWEDSMSTSGWAPTDKHNELSQDLRCISIGYVIADTKDRVILAQSQSTHGSAADTISIPRSAVRRVSKVVTR